MHGHTALMYACKTGAFDVAEQLVQDGAKQDAVSNQNETAMQIAVKNGHQSIVNMLTKNAKKSA